MRGPLLVLALLLAGCSAPVAPPPPSGPGPGAPVVEVVAEGLEVPWGLAFAPDGRIFVTERTGSVRVIEQGRLRPEPVATIQAARDGEGGLLGIALDPDFARTQLVYVMYTYGASDTALLNRVVRFTEAGGNDDERVLLDGIQGTTVHDGGRLKFGPDGKLYATTGDAANGALAQADASLNGKVLRLNPDGSIPADNPSPSSPVWTRGHRNPQGLAWDGQGRLFATEHGPSGFDGPGGFDELNLLERGQNYGWPQRYCDRDRAPAPAPLATRDPLACYEQAIAPAGLAWVPPDSRLPWAGSFLFGALRGQQLRHVALQGGAVTSDEALFEGTYGRVRDVAVGPDGLVYFTTSNRDGRGDPRDGDDHVYRLAPAR